MKKIFITVISILLLFSLFIPASAYDYSGGERASVFNDFADLVDQFKEKELLNRLEEISETYECEVAVLTVSTTSGKDLTEFADDYYDTFGFGYSENDDGIMLVITMDIREYVITANGTATEIFSDSDFVFIENEFIGFLKEEEYYDAFSAFASGCESVLYNYLYGNEDVVPYGKDEIPDPEPAISNNPLSEMLSLKWIGVSVIIGIVIGFIYLAFLKSQMKSVKRQPAASEYIVPGSFNLTQQRDIYLYGNVKKTPKPKSNNSSSGKSSFGGSARVSSSGRVHTGTRGKF